MTNCPPECDQEEKEDGAIDVEGDYKQGIRGWHEWEEGDRLLAVMEEEGEGWGIRAHATTATEIAVANQVKRDVKEIIPAHYLIHREVFEKETFDELHQETCQKSDFIWWCLIASQTCCLIMWLLDWDWNTGYLMVWWFDSVWNTGYLMVWWSDSVWNTGCLVSGCLTASDIVWY
jgi:hypothetical protein